MKQSAELLIYVGTYTGKKSRGIYAYRYDAVTGRVTSLGLAAETAHPSFLAVHPSQRFLYATNETVEYERQASGAVSAFRIAHDSGKLIFLNQVSSRGDNPCFLTVDKTGKNLLLANYGSGSVAVIRVLEDGRLGEASAEVRHSGSSVHRERQQRPHAHSINLSPDGRFALAADLGTDQVMIYRFDAAKGTLVPHHPSSVTVNPGAGPRHLAFHPNGRLVVVLNELQSTLSVFSFDAAGGILQLLETISTLPGDFAGGNAAGEVLVHAGGKFVYGSNRGHDSIADLEMDATSGALKLIQCIPTQGKTPRHFAIDPSGSRLFVANQDSDRVVVFRVDSMTGCLTPTGQVLEVPSPACINFVACLQQ